MPADNEQYGLRQKIGFAAGLSLFAVILIIPLPPGMEPRAQSAAAVAALMAIWWITEATSIPITALLPLGLFPLLDIMPSRAVAAHYANHIIFLFVGGFIIAIAMERWNLHRRVALATISFFGTRPDRLVLGFMCATAFLSMWISNTATTMMMLPIAMAVVTQLAVFAEIEGVPKQETPGKVQNTFGLILLLGVAYSASVGGIGTIIGSPTTVAFLGFAQDRFPDQPPIAFLDWSMMCIPIVIVFLPIIWLYLCRFGAEIPLNRIHFRGGQDVIAEERRRLGPMSSPEKTVLAVSTLTALLWIFRRPLELGAVTVPGWSSLFAAPGSLHDATVAISMAILLCLLPARAGDGAGKSLQFIVDWPSIQKGVPWGIVILLGGGFALAAGIEQTGLARWLGSQLTVLEGVPVWVLVMLTCLLSVTLTETTSNIATVLMVSPVLAATALEIGVHPYLLLIPAAVIASFAFMLPVATPPNAIVFGSGWITIPRMFKAGVMLDLIALAVIPLAVYFIGSFIFPFGE
jgi:sodium-dependent dicarboxylate transporter 2/3/5